MLLTLTTSAYRQQAVPEVLYRRQGNFFLIGLWSTYASFSESHFRIFLLTTTGKLRRCTFKALKMVSIPPKLLGYLGVK